MSGGRGSAHPWRLELTAPEPAPGSMPGTLVIGEGPRSRIFVIDYDATIVEEKELASPDDVVPYLEDDRPTTTWVDVRGICDAATFRRLGEIFKIHPLALEDLVNVPQRPKTDEYPHQHLIISRMVQLDDEGSAVTEQMGIVFGEGFVMTVQEEMTRDCLESVRERIRKGRGAIRTAGADYLAYALLDAVIDGFYPVLETLGERLEHLEIEATHPTRPISREIHDVKRELLTVRRAIWPQRDVLSALLREEGTHVSKETRVYLRDTYDHTVQIMDMVETFREIASGLMDLYLSGMSARMNEVMKVLTIISTIFLPLTFIAGVYGMNFDPDASPFNMPELRWRYGYPFSLGVMGLSVIVLLGYYRRKRWLARGDGREADRKSGLPPPSRS